MTTETAKTTADKERRDKINTMTPTEMFNYLKVSASNSDNDDLEKYYANASKLLDKALKTGQTAAISKLMFVLQTIEREKKVRELGIDKFIYTDDLSEYIQKVENRVVKIIDLKDYPREIPDEIVETIISVQDYFDNLLVIFTDYTGEVEQHVKETDRDKDPILVGVFNDNTTNSVTERLYFLGDWEDEYCDLTLSKLVEEYKELTEEELVYYTDQQTTDSLQGLGSKYLDNLKRKDNKTPQNKATFFSKVFSVLGLKKKNG